MCGCLIEQKSKKDRVPGLRLLSQHLCLFLWPVTPACDCRHHMDRQRIVVPLQEHPAQEKRLHGHRKALHTASRCSGGHCFIRRDRRRTPLLIPSGPCNIHVRQKVSLAAGELISRSLTRRALRCVGVRRVSSPVAGESGSRSGDARGPGIRCMNKRFRGRD